VHTPSHNYTLGELTDLFKATGDMQAVRAAAAAAAQTPPPAAAAALTVCSNCWPSHTMSPGISKA
jgi:cytochrome c553